MTLQYPHKTSYVNKRLTLQAFQHSHLQQVAHKRFVVLCNFVKLVICLVYRDL